MDALLTVPEVAKTLHVSPRSVRSLIACGKIPVVRPCRRSVRVAPADLAAFIADRKS